MRTTIKRSAATLALLMAALLPSATRAQGVADPPPINWTPPANWLPNALSPDLVWRGQSSAGVPNYSPPDNPTPVPLFSTRPSEGGLWFAGEYVMFKQTNPLKPQVIAVRGFTVTAPNLGQVGGFVGSAETALDVQQTTGPSEYAPGFKMDIGYKFPDGTSISVDWMYLASSHRTAGATFAAPGFNVGQDFVNSFISAPVFGFPNAYSGPDDITDAAGVPIPGGATGIWNAASIMTLEFTQRTQQYDITYRLNPWCETEDTRITCEVGARFFWIWERFLWRTVDLDTFGNGGDQNTAVYTNITSNRMYGPFINQSWEQYLGGGFAFQFDLGAALLLDVVKERAGYSIATRMGPDSRRARTDYTVVPEATAKVSLMWYPTEGIQVRAGYNGMAFFNTVGMQNPVSFDFTGLDPKYDRIFRMFDGLDLGVAFIF